ncbi:unnamed protein product [Paramecium octaurelia]|uniref:Uncharacterized protein n=1 Tax=Paramecium octaurelia TaxID=43137 RepID=A0A8S1XRE1_PAROT|nr:unnamed protein product [Paramecium octaurelia]
MDRSTHSNARPASGSKDKNDLGKKEHVIAQLEQIVMERLKSTIKDIEVEQERQMKQKQDQGKNDQVAVALWQKIKGWTTDQSFKKAANQITENQKIPQEARQRFAKPFLDQQKLIMNIEQDKSKVKIKLNEHYQTLAKSTQDNLNSVIASLGRLAQAGCCGKGEALRSFETEFRKIELDFIQWQALPNLENNNVDIFVVKTSLNYEEFRQFLIKSLNDYFPSAAGETKIIEKPVDKIVYVDKPVDKIVYVDKPVEKIVYVDKPVEKKVIEYVEKVKEVPVYRDQPVQDDRLRIAHEMLYGIGRPQNVTEALNLYYELAEVNQDVNAFNIIAQVFSEGKIFPKDLNKAYTYWERSAAQQNAEGLYRIGRLLLDQVIDGQMLSQGKLQTRDEQKSEAVVFFQQASEQGHLDALVDLGEIFENGLKSEDGESYIQEPNLESAEFYYTQGKKVRYPRAINALGLFYYSHTDFQEKVVGNNYRKALKYFEIAKDLGYANSLYWLAQCYEYGYGVGVNLEQAKSYYKEGALKGDVACRLQYMHYVMKDCSNSGRQEDYLFAHQYLIQIMIQNPEITEVYFYLGHLYECGFGVQKDPQNAIHYYFKGAKLKNPTCMTKLGDCYHSGFGVPQNQREALKFYKEAAELKDSEALINMGLIYEQGYEGVSIDFAKAFNAYEESSKLGNAKADFHLGLMYEAGKYVKKDVNFAIQRYQRAAQLGCQEARDLLKKKQIPMLYDDSGSGNTFQDLGIHAANRDAIMLNQVIPQIQNPLVINQGKKTNQSIIAYKSQHQEMGEGKMVSILAHPNASQSNYVQSQYQKPGFQH